LLLIQCKISLYLGPVRPVRCFVTFVPAATVTINHQQESHMVDLL